MLTSHIIFTNVVKIGLDQLVQLKKKKNYEMVVKLVQLALKIDFTKINQKTGEQMTN